MPTMMQLRRGIVARKKGVLPPVQVPTVLALASGGTGYSNRAIISPDGVNWQVSNIPALNWLRCAYDPIGKRFFAITANAIYQSLNGIDWTAKTAPVTDMTDIAVSATGRVAVVHPNGVHYSDNGGTSWTASDLPAGTYNRIKWLAGRAVFWVLPTGTQVMEAADGATWIAAGPTVPNLPWVDVAECPASGFPARVIGVNSSTAATFLQNAAQTNFGSSTIPSEVGRSIQGPIYTSGSIGVGALAGVISGGNNDVMQSANGTTWAAIAASGNQIQTIEIVPSMLKAFAAQAAGSIKSKVEPVSGTPWADATASMNWVSMTSGIVAAAPAPSDFVKYWRFRFTETNDTGNNYVSPAEIQLRQEKAVAVIMANFGAADANTTFTPPTYSADKAIDQLSSTCWISGQGSWQVSWWRMTFTEPRSVKEVMLQAFNTAPGAIQMPAGLILEYSADNITWNIAMLWEGQHTWSSSETRTYPVPGQGKARPVWNKTITASGTTPYGADVKPGDICLLQYLGAAAMTGIGTGWTLGTTDTINSPSVISYAWRVLTSGDIAAGIPLTIAATNDICYASVFRGATSLVQRTVSPAGSSATLTIPGFTPDAASKGVYVVRADRDPAIFPPVPSNNLLGWLPCNRKSSTLFSFGTDYTDSYQGGNIIVPVTSGSFLAVARAFEFL